MLINSTKLNTKLNFFKVQVGLTQFGSSNPLNPGVSHCIVNNKGMKI
jgi:hypothetical protein